MAIRTRHIAGAAVAAFLAFPGAASAAVNSAVTGGELSVSATGGESIAITCEGGNVKVNGFDPDGVVACTTITEIDVQGGPGNNLIDLTGVLAGDYSALTSVAADGGDGDDELRGSGIADELAGGIGDDRLVAFTNPAGSRDEMAGGEGDDTLVWNPGDGSDTMDGEAGNDTIEVNGGGAAEQFTVAPGAGGRIAFDRVTPGPFNLDIGSSESLDLNAGGGDDTLNQAGGAAGLAPFAIDADGGDGNDLLQGGDAADVLTGGIGNDRLVAFRNPAGSRDRMSGGEGDDTLVWNPGDGDDTMDGEAGSDTAEVNGGGGGEQFEVKPSATPGRVQFDRTGPTPPGPFNLDIGSTERLDLNANGGNDEVGAASGLAALIGLDLDGGAGDDAIQARNGATDQIACGTENDSVAADAQDAVGADCETVDRGDTGQPGDDVAPVAAVARRAVRVNAGRKARIRVTGADDEDSRVTLALRRNGRLLGRAARDVPAGEARTIRVKLSRGAFALLKRRGTLRVRAIATAVDEAGNRGKSAVWITLRSPEWQR